MLEWLVAQDIRLAAHAVPIREAAAQCSAAVGETVDARELLRVLDANPGRVVWRPGSLPGPEDGFLSADQWAALRSAAHRLRPLLAPETPLGRVAHLLQCEVEFPVTPPVARLALSWLDAQPAGVDNGPAIDH